MQESERKTSRIGRLGRGGYSWRTLVLLIAEAVILPQFINAHSHDAQELGVPLVAGAFALLMAWFTVKRFHDMNRSGWSYFLLLIPLFNIYVGFQLLLVKGTDGPNRYGPPARW
jgi:uncharacterized membrane protein YhaH (DUF805 family)